MYQPVFRDAVPTSEFRQWWTLIRQLVGQIYGVKLPGIGRTPARARKLQEILGVKRLPPSLVEWIAMLEDVRRLSDWATEDLTTCRARHFPEHKAVSLNAGSIHDGWAQWGMALADFRHDDPPVNVYGYLMTRDEHVLRKSYPRLPLTQWALHTMLGTAGSNYGWMGSDLDDPEEFLIKVAAKAPVSVPFGSLRFIEGRGWLAYVCNGPTEAGRDKRLTLRFTDGVKFRDIPQPIRDQVQLKPSHLRSTYRRKHSR